MKNINRDYLVIVDARTAKITPPKDMKFYITDENTSNIFFQLVFEDYNDKDITSLINDKVPQRYDIYSLTLRVVKPNYETAVMEIYPLNQDDPCFFVADLTEEFINVSGICECELFIDAHIIKDDMPTIERSTTDVFEYEVKESVFFNVDEILDYHQIAIENIATKDYVDGVVSGNVSMSRYVTAEQLETKANVEHVHEDYVSKEELETELERIDKVKIDLYDFEASNSISVNRKKYTPIGKYSSAIGDETVASGDCSHAEGYRTQARGKGAHAEGLNTKASGLFSHAEGSNTTANAECQHVQGKYNVFDSENQYAHIVGNGKENAPSNAHTLDWNGNAWFAGNVYIGADNLILATKDYVDDKISKIVISGSGSNPDNPGGDIIVDCNCNPHEPYDDTELRNNITSLNSSVTALSNSLDNKANKKIAADNYERISSISLGNVGLNSENRKYINVLNPSSNLSIQLPYIADVDFAEIHMFIMPMSNDTEVSFSESVAIKYQDKDMIPETLEANNAYEYIFTYINCNDSYLWLVGAIVYE